MQRTQISIPGSLRNAIHVIASQNNWDIEKTITFLLNLALDSEDPELSESTKQFLDSKSDDSPLRDP